MPRLIFDIETIGVDFEKLDEKSKEFVLKYAESPEEQEEAKDGLAFSPLTGEVVAIGILNPDTDKGAVYFRDESGKLEKESEKNIQYTPLPSEKEILKEFWETAQLYDQFVTFNGRGFDCPYLIIRSALHKIKPSKNLMPNRYESDQFGKIITHVDLLDRLTFFGSVRRKGNLHMWCKAFDIDSPKAKGITGDDVGQLFKEKKYMDIARYCAGDLWATKDLFNYWEKYINIK
ncbi:MAG: ribonuclease H-like domain-containing protein [Candidatus Taylorbacteria bacterium]|nr:ribonuclease H-like domain-containing protein [Candidatus Taylorbacteria bacterium]